MRSGHKARVCHLTRSIIYVTQTVKAVDYVTSSAEATETAASTPFRLSGNPAPFDQPPAVARSAPAPDMNEIGVAQDAMAKRSFLRVRQAEQGRALPGGENGTARHGSCLSKIMDVCAMLIVI